MSRDGLTRQSKSNWVSTVGANINEVEKQVAAKVERKYVVALSTGTAALHLAIKICGEKLYCQLSLDTVLSKVSVCSPAT